MEEAIWCKRFNIVEGKFIEVINEKETAEITFSIKDSTAKEIGTHRVYTNKQTCSIGNWIFHLYSIECENSSNLRIDIDAINSVEDVGCNFYTIAPFAKEKEEILSTLIQMMEEISKFENISDFDNRSEECEGLIKRIYKKVGIL